MRRTSLAIDVAQRHGQERKRLLGTRGRAQAAADQHVVADELAVLHDRQEPQVVGMNIRAIVFRQGECRLELAGKIGLAVERLDGIVGGGWHERTARPAAAIRSFRRRPRYPSTWSSEERSARPSARRRTEGQHRTSSWIGAGQAEHIPLDITAGSQGREQAFVDASDRRLQIVLEHAVKLKLLASRDSQAAVADRLRQLVARQILLGREASAHDPHPHHELEGVFLAFLLERPRRSRSSCW